MIRSLAVLTVLALGLPAALAQEAAPAAPAAIPAATDIVIDPAAPLPSTAKQADLLTGFYATLAVIDICDLPIAEDIKLAMDGDQQRLQASVGLDAPSAAGAYAKVRADVEKTAPDCADGSPDRASVDAVTAIYVAAAAETAAALAAPATPIAPAQ